tara:strand:- start:5468 stop:6952 length:1485 start_codon:yes stop_codon:yes gene_type:complete
MSEKNDFAKAFENTDENLDLSIGEEFASLRKTPPKSDTCIWMDKWSERRGYELFHESAAIRKALRALDCDQRDKEAAAADFFALAFEPNVCFAYNAKNAKLLQYLQAIQDTVEFRQLQADTVYDDMSSEIAAVQFAREYAKIEGEITEPTKPREGEGEEEGKAAGEGEGEGKSDSLSAKIEKAISEAVKKASGEVDEVNDMREAFGKGGSGEGARGGKVETSRTIELFNRAKRNSDLKRISQLAGRYRRIAQSVQQSKVKRGQDDMVGVEMGGKFSQLLASERFKLACGIPEIEDAATMRLLENRAMVRDHRKNEPIGAGPIVIVCDESGSMHGEHIHQAKAISLAMYWLAKQQNRWCCLMGFSGGDSPNLLTLKPEDQQDMTEQVFDWCEHFFSGGNECDLPIYEMPSLWKKLEAPEGKTDVLMVTDAHADASELAVSDWNEWKANSQAKVTTICIGGYLDEDNCTGTIPAISDSVEFCDELNDIAKEVLASV